MKKGRHPNATKLAPGSLAHLRAGHTLRSAKLSVFTYVFCVHKIMIQWFLCMNLGLHPKKGFSADSKQYASSARRVPLKQRYSANRFHYRTRIIQTIPLQPTMPLVTECTTDLIGMKPKRFVECKTLVLDLDKTLFSVDNVEDWQAKKCDVALRPHAHKFITLAKDLFEVIVWTRSTEYYAKKKCKWLGLHDVPLITGMQHCDKNGAKPLYKLNRDITQVLLFDDNPIHLIANPRSQLLITPWLPTLGKCTETDVELLDAIPILKEIAQAETVQSVLDIHLANMQSFRNSLY